MEHTTQKLAESKKLLYDEIRVREAHEETESELAKFSQELMEVANNAIMDVKSLHAIVEVAVSKERKHQKDLKSVKDNMNNNFVVLQEGSARIQASTLQGLEDISTQITALVGENHSQLVKVSRLLDESHSDIDAEHAKELRGIIESSFSEIGGFMGTLQETRTDICLKIKEGFDHLELQSNALSKEACAKLDLIENSLGTTLEQLQIDTTALLHVLQQHLEEQLASFDVLRSNFGLKMNEMERQLQTAEEELAKAVALELERATAEKEELLEQVTRHITRSHDTRAASLKSLETSLRKGYGKTGDEVRDARDNYMTGLAAWSHKLKRGHDATITSSVLKLSECIEAVKTHESQNLRDVQAKVKSELDEKLGGMISQQVKDLDNKTAQLTAVMNQAQELTSQRMIECTDGVSTFAATVRESQKPVLSSLNSIKILNEKSASDLNREMRISQVRTGLDSEVTSVGKNLDIGCQLVSAVDTAHSCFGGDQIEGSGKRPRSPEYYDEMMSMKLKVPKRTRCREDIINGITNE